LTSKYLPLLLRSQSYGDLALKGDRTDVALRGESLFEKAGDGGMRSFILVEEGAEEGWTNGEGKTAEVGSL
jgi:hypothetical protein